MIAIITHIMHRIFLIAILLVSSFLLMGCDKAEKSADAYGNVEAVSVLVSAQASGQLLSFEIAQGDILARSIQPSAAAWTAYPVFPQTFRSRPA